MEKRQLTSDDLVKMPMDQALTRRDWVRILRTALERNPSPGTKSFIELIMSVILEDSGFGTSARQELINELPTMSMQELRVVRNALLLLRTEKKDEPQDPNK